MKRYTICALDAAGNFIFTGVVVAALSLFIDLGTTGYLGAILFIVLMEILKIQHDLKELLLAQRAKEEEP